jgi:hypothetical protein
MTARVRLSAQALVRRQPLSPKMTWPLGPSVVQLPVRCATTQAFAADLIGQRPTITGHPRAALGDFLHFAGAYV